MGALRAERAGQGEGGSRRGRVKARAGQDECGSRRMRVKARAGSGECEFRRVRVQTSASSDECEFRQVNEFTRSCQTCPGDRRRETEIRNGDQKRRSELALAVWACCRVSDHVLKHTTGRRGRRKAPLHRAGSMQVPSRSSLLPWLPRFSWYFGILSEKTASRQPARPPYWDAVGWRRVKTWFPRASS